MYNMKLEGEWTIASISDYGLDSYAIWYATADNVLRDQLYESAGVCGRQIGDPKPLYKSEVQTMIDRFRQYFAIPWRYKDYMIERLLCEMILVCNSPTVSDINFRILGSNIQIGIDKALCDIHKTCTNPFCQHEGVCNLCPISPETTELFSYALMIHFINL